MDISLLLEPQTKHQRMYRGESMYGEQSLAEITTMPCQYCNQQSVPKTYVKQCDIGKPKYVNTVKCSWYKSVEKRIFSNRHVSKDEKRRALKTSVMINSERISISSVRRRDGREEIRRKWRDDSNKLKAAMNIFREARKAQLQHNL